MSAMAGHAAEARFATWAHQSADFTDEISRCLLIIFVVNNAFLGFLLR